MGIGALSSGMSGMRAAQRRLDLASHNIANAQTQGYQRQVLEQRAVGFDDVPGVFSPSTIEPGGTIALGVTRRTELGLYKRVVTSQGDAAMAGASARELRKLEAVFPEPDENAIGGQFAEFWASWQGVANQPSSSAARTALLAQSRSLITSLRAASADIQDLRNRAGVEVDMTVAQVNALARELAATASAAQAGDPTLSATQDLLSHRDHLATELAGKIGGRVNIMEDGTFQFLVGGRPLVEGPNVSTLQYVGGTVQWAADATPAEIGGTIAGLQSAITSGFDAYATQIDAVAAAVVADVNSLHQLGFDQAGNPGGMFFDPAGTTAATIALDANVDGSPQNIAAGGVAAVEDGDMARQIAALALSPTGPDAMYRDMIAQLGVDARLADGRASSTEALAESLDMSLQETTGVNIDQETVEIMAAQRAFQAAARVITAVDEMLATLIERTGVVGR